MEHTRDVDLTPGQLHAVRLHADLIRKTIEHLPADDREFLLTGIMPHEWDEAA